VVMLLIRYGKLQLAFAKDWEEEYHIKPVEEKPHVHVRALAEDVVEEDDEEATSKPVKKKTVAKPKAETTVKAKPVTKKKVSKPKEPKQ
jgi:hypothetical protein